MVNKSTRGLHGSASDRAFDKIFVSPGNPSNQNTSFDLAVTKMSGPIDYKGVDAELSSKLVLLEKLKLAKDRGMPDSVIQEYETRLGFKSETVKGNVKGNMEKMALLEAAAAIEDPEIKAAILDLIYPENSNDPLHRVERIIKAKQAAGPKQESIQDKMFMVMFEKMMDRAEAPGQSPVESFVEMLQAVEKFKEASGQGKKDGTDISTVEGLIKAKEYMEKLNIIDNKNEKIEGRKLDIEEKKVTAQMEIEKAKVEREFQERKDNMETVKEMSEILSKAATRIFDKSGSSNTTKNERSAEKQPVMMYCTNPACKYSKEQFEIVNPDQVGEMVELIDGKETKTKGRAFPCPNDRGGCPNKYVLREGRQVEQFDTNIDPRKDDEVKK